MTRNSKLAILIFGGAIAIAAVMIFIRPQPEQKPLEQLAPLVETVPLEIASGPLMVLGSGTVQPTEEVAIGAEVGGRLVFVNPAFREGGNIRAGEVLFRIDAADFQNRVRSAQADVAAQSVAVLEAEEELQIAKQELSRFEQREAGRSAMRGSIDRTDYAARFLPPPSSQETTPAGADAASPAMPNRLATREPQLRSAEAARDRAEANLADARLSLARTTVKAPFAGLVGSESASIGSLVQPGQVLGTIASTDSYEVKVSMTEKEASLIPGLFRNTRSKARATVDFDYGGVTYRWNAMVDRANAILDPQTRMIDVFVRVPSPLRGGKPVVTNMASPGLGRTAPPLLIGSFVRVAITGGTDEPYAEIPANAIRPGDKIWLVRDGKLRILPVRVIERTDTFAYVTTRSLNEGGRVIIGDLRVPVDGMTLRHSSNGAAK